MNIPLVVAGSAGVLAAAVHGAGGELLVMRKLSTDVLPGTRFGGPRMTRAMIHVAWHLTTVAFLTVGVALLLAGLVLDGDAADAIGIGAAGAASGFAAVTLGLGAKGAPRRAMLTHPGPAVLTAIAVFAWLGVL